MTASTTLLQVLLWIGALCTTTTVAHSLGAHGLQGGDPPNTPVLPEVTGAFEGKVTARFDNLAGVGYDGWQTIFEMTVAIGEDSIFFGQNGYGNGIRFGLYNGTTEYFVDLPNTITQGVEGTWHFGVTQNGTMWIQKDGDTERITKDAAVPPNIVRPQKFIGDGLWYTPLDPLQGAVLGIQIRNLSDPVTFSDLDLLNLPGQMWGGFTVSFYARFDRLDGAAKLFCFGNDSMTDFISFGQSSSASTSAGLTVRTNNVDQTVMSIGSMIVADEMAFWHVTVNVLGEVIIRKNGNTVYYFFNQSGMIPSQTFRRNHNIGKGCTQLATEQLDGVVLGLRVDAHQNS